MRSLRTPSRLVAAPVAALALALTLAACGSDSDKGDDKKTDAPKADVLSETEATSALLIEDNLGGLFTIDAEDDTDSDAPGCMKAVADVLGEDDEAEETAEHDYSAVDESTAVVLSNKVLSYESDEAAEAAVEKVRAGLKDCTEVTETDEDGYTFDLKVESADEKTEDVADEQVNALASGSVSVGSDSGEANLYLAVVRIGNNVTALTASTIDSELPGPFEDVITVATDRLAAVGEGEQPDDSVVAGR